MKYVIIDGGGMIGEYPVIFPKEVSHDTFKDHNIVSAGFVRIVGIDGISVTCFGDSYSLQKKSRKQDSEIIKRGITGHK